MSVGKGEREVNADGAGEARRTQVVILGAGFGGLWAARALANEAVSVVLVDRNNYHTFLPLLYQVAAAEIGPEEIAYPVRSILRRAVNVAFRVGDVMEVDLDGGVVVTARERIPYDYLVVAIGSVPNFFGVEGAAEHAFRLRDMADALPLRQHILRCFEAAVCESDVERRRRLLTFVIVGGGATGVEYAGALAELMFGPLLRDYPMFGPDDVAVVLLEATDGLLSGYPDPLSRYARDRLARRGVDVRLGAAVTRLNEQGLELGDGARIASETVVWTAGVRGDPQVERWGLPVVRGGRVPVTPTLQLEVRPDVYVVGDLAYLEEDGQPLPQVAQVAMQQGKHAAANILRQVRGQPSEPFRYRDYGTLAVIGRNAAVARIAGRSFRGLPAWLLWLGIHITWLIGFRNRVLVLVNWAWNYLMFRRAVRLILPDVRGRNRMGAAP